MNSPLFIIGWTFYCLSSSFNFVEAATPSLPPTNVPSLVPSLIPSTSPSVSPTVPPTGKPTKVPTNAPSASPTIPPSPSPSLKPTTSRPTTSISPTLSSTTSHVSAGTNNGGGGSDSSGKYLVYFAAYEDSGCSVSPIGYWFFPMGVCTHSPAASIYTKYTADSSGKVTYTLSADSTDSTCESLAYITSLTVTKDSMCTDQGLLFTNTKKHIYGLGLFSQTSNSVASYSYAFISNVFPTLPGATMLATYYYSSDCTGTPYLYGLIKPEYYADVTGTSSSGSSYQCKPQSCQPIDGIGYLTITCNVDNGAIIGAIVGVVIVGAVAVSSATSSSTASAHATNILHHIHNPRFVFKIAKRLYNDEPMFDVDDLYSDVSTDVSLDEFSDGDDEEESIIENKNVPTVPMDAAALTRTSVGEEVTALGIQGINTPPPPYFILSTHTYIHTYIHTSTPLTHLINTPTPHPSRCQRSC